MIRLYNISWFYIIAFSNDTGNNNVNNLDFSGDSCWLGAAVGQNAYFYYDCQDKVIDGPPARCPI
jgi:hypothetical protein